MRKKTTPPGRAIQIARTAAQKKLFLETIAASQSITLACLAASVTRRTHYYWLEHDAVYAEDFEHARTVEFHDRLEQEIYRRGVLGIEQAVYHEGKVIDTKRVYSDTLLIFRAKKEMPAYRDSVKVDLALQRPHKDLSDDELDERIATLGAQLRLAP